MKEETKISFYKKKLGYFVIVAIIGVLFGIVIEYNYSIGYNIQNIIKFVIDMFTNITKNMTFSFVVLVIFISTIPYWKKILEVLPKSIARAADGFANRSAKKQELDQISQESPVKPLEKEED